MNRFAVAFACFLALSSMASRAYGLAFEEFGNRPFPAANHEHWPGIIPLINAESRIYYREVNGDERFYYKGGTRDLNLALKSLAAVKSKSCQVFFRPGPANARTFEGEIVDCNWTLDLRRGFLSTRHNGDLIWLNSPVLTVYVDEDIGLYQLEIPDRLAVVSLSELKERCWKAMFDSSDSSTRGCGCRTLAWLDPYDVESAKLIRVCLRDRDQWVRLAAVDVLIVFGVKSKPALVELRQIVTRNDHRNLREAAMKAITKIEAASETPEEESRFRTAVAEIDAFVETHQAKRK